MPLKKVLPEPPAPEVDSEQAELEALKASAEKLRKEAGLLPPDLEALQTHLDQELEKLGNSPLPDLGGPPGESVDNSSNEFIQLADFVTKELQKKTAAHEPGQRSKIHRINSYKAVKEKEFEQLQLQKGIQLNKAA